METKANHILVGICALLALALFAGVFVFASKRQNAEFRTYAINFKGGVSGLSIGNDVRFNGIRVGRVSRLEIDHNEPELVRVLVDIARDTPVRENSEATLNFQGITGLTNVYISGGTADSPLLQAAPDDPVPVIRSGISALAEIMEVAPDVMTSAVRLLHSGANILSDENQKSFTATMQALAEMSIKLARQSQNLEQTLANLNTTIINMNTFFQNANTLVKDELSRASLSAQTAFDNMNRILGKVEPGVDRLAQNGLNELSSLLNDAKRLIRSLEMLTQRLDSQPRRFIFGDSIPEYTAP